MHRLLDRSNSLLPDNTNCLVDQYLRTMQVSRQYIKGSPRQVLTQRYLPFLFFAQEGISQFERALCFLPLWHNRYTRLTVREKGRVIFKLIRNLKKFSERL